MKNFKIPTVVRLIIGGILVLLLGGLAGWYYYLHSQEQTTAANTAASGLGGATPSFNGTTGSTQADQAIATQSFGTGAVTSSGSSGTSTQELWEADKAAVAGMGFVTTQTDEHLYYVERANGYVFSAHPSSASTERLTDTLMPKIYQALFAGDGSVIERSIDQGGNVTTFLGTISTSTAIASSSSNVSRAIAQEASVTPAALVGSYLAPDIQEIAMDPLTRELFYLVVDPKGGIDGITQLWDGTKKSHVFTSIVGSWRPMIGNDGVLSLLESPADGMPGYAYKVSTSGVLTPLVRNVPGLTVLSKASSALLLYGSSSGVSLSLFASATGTPRLLPLATVADKCVWLPGSSEIAYCAVPTALAPANFLDAWYKGSAHTSDDWWAIDLSLGTAKRIYSPSADNVSLDVEDPTIDASGNYIAFINATDQSLWVLHVAQ
jgi:hypothetical protein